MSLVNLNLSLNLDRTANKIAFCSAVVAGTLYVGYSVVRTAFSRRRRRHKDDEEDEFPGHRSLFLRRLSQTTQTDALLGDFDFSNGGAHQKIILRPKTVQERIRELNVRARQFADAVSAIQGNNGGSNNPRLNGVSGRSLQVTPWGSPRLLSPIDVRHIVQENSDSERDTRFSPAGSPIRQQRWTRGGSFKTTQRRIDFDVHGDARVKDCEQLWQEKKEEIIHEHLRGLLSNQNRELTYEEARYLVAILNSEDGQLVSEILGATANYAAFSANQDKLREAGLIAMIPKLIMSVSASRNVRQKICPVISNMALNENNNSEMRLVTASLAHVLLATPMSDPALMTSCLTALTNIAILSTWHHEMKCILHKSYSFLDEGHWNNNPDGLSLQSLKLLINISCNEEMIPSLLAAQAPKKLIYLLDISMPEDVLLRVTTLLANIATVTKRSNIDPLDLPAEGKAAAPDTMYAAVFGLLMVERYKKKALILSERHSNSDVCAQAHKLWTALSMDEAN